MRYFVNSSDYTEEYDIKCPVCGRDHFELSESKVMVNDRDVSTLEEDIYDNLHSVTYKTFDYEYYYTLKCKRCPTLLHFDEKPEARKED